jgi:hypothetical protein
MKPIGAAPLSIGVGRWAEHAYSLPASAGSIAAAHDTDSNERSGSVALMGQEEAVDLGDVHPLQQVWIDRWYGLPSGAIPRTRADPSRTAAVTTDPVVVL